MMLGRRVFRGRVFVFRVGQLAWYYRNTGQKPGRVLIVAGSSEQIQREDGLGEQASVLQSPERMARLAELARWIPGGTN
jgi:hypothetical protein